MVISRFWEGGIPGYVPPLYYKLNNINTAQVITERKINFSNNYMKTNQV